jgi:hypothetical protein
VCIRCLLARAGSVLAPRSNDRWRLVLIPYFARPRPAIDFALGAGKGLPLRARGWRKQKRWINGRSGDQAEALGDRAAACLLARRCKHHGAVAGVRSIAIEIADARAIRTIALEKCDCPAGATSVIACVAKRKFAPARKNSRQVLARGRRFS